MRVSLVFCFFCRREVHQMLSLSSPLSLLCSSFFFLCSSISPLRSASAGAPRACVARRSAAGARALFPESERKTFFSMAIFRRLFAVLLPPAFLLLADSPLSLDHRCDCESRARDNSVRKGNRKRKSSPLFFFQREKKKRVRSVFSIFSRNFC